MNCPKCGTKVQQDSVYCPKCGERLTAPGSELFQPKGPVATPSGSDPGKMIAEERAELDEQQWSDKETLWEGRYSFRAMIDRLAAVAVLTIVVIIVLALWKPGGMIWAIALGLVAVAWGYQFLVYVFRHYGHRYRLTPHTFFHESGLFVRTSSPLEIVHIDDLSLQQTLLDRLVGVGTIRILSHDTTDPKLVLPGIPDVEQAFAKIDQTRRAERRRRAVRLDNI